MLRDVLWDDGGDEGELLVRITPHHSSLYHTNCRQHPVVLIRHCVDIMLVFASDWARL